MSNQIQQVTELLRKCETERFFGQLTVQFRAGAIELVRQERTFKLEGNSHNDRVTR